jgi:hypothetical protein
MARDALAAMTANEQRCGRPTATVLSVANRSQSARLNFLEGSLGGLLEDLLESQGYRVLRRNNAGLLAKETTLGVSGMVRPDAAVLAEAADLVVTASFAESPSGTVAFEQTPINLTLGLKRRSESNRDVAFTFTLEEMKKLTDSLRSVLPAAGAAARVTTAPMDDLVSQRMEAARLMAELKDLPYMAPLEDHRRQIKLAQRVIYLDPSAKEVYYRLGISLDSLTRQTWGRGQAHEGSSQDTADALSRYLHFPRTDPEHVRWAFTYLAVHEDVLNKDTPGKFLPLLAEYVRWRHEQDPVNPPIWTCAPGFYSERWWEGHAKERYEFYTWIDSLYQQKKHLSVVPFRLALACDQLKQYDKAAEYLYDGLVSHRLGQLELNGVTGGEVSSWWQSGRSRELAKFLDAKRSAELLARLGGGVPKADTGLAAMYGPAYGTAKNLYEYRYHADRQRIAGMRQETAPSEAVPVGQTLIQSLIVRRTKAGLWVQGGTDEGTMAVFFTEDGRSWRALKAPEEMGKILGYEGLAVSRNHVVSIVQLDSEVLFATANVGLFVYNRQADTWRSYGVQQGLPAKHIAQMAASADGKFAWIAGGGFLCRYQDGRIFLGKGKMDMSPDGLVACGEHPLILNEDRSLVLNPEGQGSKPLFTRAQLRPLVPTPPRFDGLSRSYYAGAHTCQRLQLIDKNIYLACDQGLAVLTSDGRPVRLWRPDDFYHWNNLGGWVLGNCPLPPCSLLEVLRDDRKPGLLWLVSKDNDIIPPYSFAYGTYPKKLWGAFAKFGDDTACFITAFDTETTRFSKPIRTKSFFAHAQPFGDYVYLTGRTFSRLPKSLWVVDQPGSQTDQPPKVECPDTPVGRASGALLLGQRDQAVKQLQEALSRGIAPDEIRKTLRDLAAQSRPAE